MSLPNQAEQFMLTLINEERAQAGLNPLSFNGDLNESAEDHSDWMLDSGQFSHRGEGGSDVQERAVEAGYALEGNWAIGENIGWQSERGAPGIEDDVRDIHESLMNSPGHRANILSANYDEIGIGIEVGDFRGYDGVMVTQNFGATDAETAPPVPPVDPEPPVTEEPVPDTDGDPQPPEGPKTPETPDTPVAEGPDPDTDGDPQQPETPETPVEVFDADAFIAQLTALLESFFDSIDFAAFEPRTPDPVTDMMPWTGRDDDQDDAGQDGGCPGWSDQDFAMDTSPVMTFDWDFI